MIKLALTLKDAPIEEFSLEKDPIHIGRARENDIVIDNIAVSRKHALILQKGSGGYFLRDLQSSNGTFLNGAQIGPGDHPLSDGAVIGIGKFDLLVKGLPKAAPLSPKAPAQEDVQGTMIFDPSRRKPPAEPKATPASAPASPPEPKPIRWPVISMVKGPQKGMDYKINKEVTLVGKGSQSDIPAHGWLVSSPHARISRRGGRFYISHLGGFFSNTKVNGIGIKEEHILKNKDQVEIGCCSFLFTQPPAEHSD